jgi:hypothetical protein
VSITNSISLFKRIILNPRNEYNVLKTLQDVRDRSDSTVLAMRLMGRLNAE